jgi:hypothetical protein
LVDARARHTVNVAPGVADFLITTGSTAVGS